MSAAYFDYHATTPVDPRVLQRMLPYFSEHFGNASSRTHAHGWRANEAVEVARKQVANAIGTRDERAITFTSGATEALQLAIFGIAQGGERTHLITVATEHRAVLEQHEALRMLGFSVDVLPVDSRGQLSPQTLQAALRPDTALVSVMWVNNETAVVQPIQELCALSHQAGALFLCDASQALGRVAIDLEAVPVDALVLSAHKAYGPKGVGALYAHRKRVDLKPQAIGGGHERGLRAGTLNVPGIVGFGAAAELAATEREADQARLAVFQRDTEQALSAIADVRINSGSGVAGTVNASFAGLRGEALLSELRDFALSSGAACSSADQQPSHVLTAMGLSKELAHASLRIAFGRPTTPAEVQSLCKALPAAISRLRTASV